MVLPGFCPAVWSRARHNTCHLTASLGPDMVKTTTGTLEASLAIFRIKEHFSAPWLIILEEDCAHNQVINRMIINSRVAYSKTQLLKILVASIRLGVCLRHFRLLQKINRFLGFRSCSRKWLPMLVREKRVRASIL